MKIKDVEFIYLNCEKDKNKKENIIKQWENTNKYCNENIKISRFDAIYYKDLSSSYFTEYCDISSESKIKDQIHNIAVFKSHQSIYKKIIDEEIKYAFIFEDDVIIPNNFLHNFENSLLNIPSSWDILFFGLLNAKVEKTKYNDWNKILPLKKYNNGLHAYFVNLNGVKKIYRLILENGIQNQIDIFLRDNAEKFNFFIYKQLLIKQDTNFESTRINGPINNNLKKIFNNYQII